MKRITMLMAVGAALLMATPDVSAQNEPAPDRMKKRRRDRIKHRGDRMKHRRDGVKRPPHGMKRPPMMVRRVTPQTVAPGATVTIRGRGFVPGMKIKIGRKRRIVPTAVTPRRITFVVPMRVRPGSRALSIVHRRRIMPAGTLTITAAGAVATAPPTTASPDTPTTSAPPPDAREARRRRRHRKRWQGFRARPVVYGFRPKRGRTGRRIVIRGRNFAPGAQVFVNRQAVPTAKVTARRIVFRMPATKRPRAIIRIRQANARRPMLVGIFETRATDVDRAEETRRKAEEARRVVDMRKAAQDRWRKRRAAMAKTRAARFTAYKTRWQDLRTRRRTRRAKRVAAYRTRWKAKFLGSDQVHAELALHSRRTARLRQMLRLAEVDNMAKIVVRIQVALVREDARHSRRMRTLKIALAADVGAAK